MPGSVSARVLFAMLLTLTPALFIQVHTAMSVDAHVQPYVRPEFAHQMQTLRPTILEAAQRHNRPELSGMDDREFATTIAQILYNEHFGWLEEALPPLQALTPAYQLAQININQLMGSDFTVWPSNLRPSVAVEILYGELPVADQPGFVAIPVHVQGSQINLHTTRDQQSLYRVVNAEISQPDLAIEFLAANLERGVYRARREGVPVTWQALAAWHNQGIVRPADIKANPTARHYIHRASAYRATAAALLAP